MIRLLRLGLLVVALTGLIGQSSAIAMAKAAPVVRDIDTSNSPQAGMDCTHMPIIPGQDQAPCKRMSLQCIAAMGCSSLAVTLTDVQTSEAHSLESGEITPRAVTRLKSRSYAPEPDPPSFLI